MIGCKQVPFWYSNGGALNPISQKTAKTSLGMVTIARFEIVRPLLPEGWWNTVFNCSDAEIFLLHRFAGDRRLCAVDAFCEIEDV